MYICVDKECYVYVYHVCCFLCHTPHTPPPPPTTTPYTHTHTQQGDQVKKGQAIYFVEQLGTHVAVEAPQGGEVVALFKEDGDPVEYAEEVATIAPFFGGNKE